MGIGIDIDVDMHIGSDMAKLRGSLYRDLRLL